MKGKPERQFTEQQQRDLDDAAKLLMGGFKPPSDEDEAAEIPPD